MDGTVDLVAFVDVRIDGFSIRNDGDILANARWRPDYRLPAVQEELLS